MIPEELQERLDEFQETADYLKLDLMLYCKDKSIALDNRWEIFKEAHRLYFTIEDKFIIEMPKEIKTFFDKKVYSRYRTVDVFDFIEDLIDDEDNDFTETSECILTFKEDLLQSFVGTFEVDW